MVHSVNSVGHSGAINCAIVFALIFAGESPRLTKVNVHLPESDLMTARRSGVIPCHCSSPRRISTRSRLNFVHFCTKESKYSFQRERSHTMPARHPGSF